MNDDVQLVREIGEVKAELSGLKAEVAGTNQRLDDIVITQLKDHGKRLAALDVRIAALEAAENKRAGGLSVLAGVAAAAGSLGALIMKDYGVNCALVDFGGASERLAALLGSQVDVATCAYAAAKEYVDRGAFFCLG